MQDIIIATVKKFPEEIKEFIYEQIMFYEVDSKDKASCINLKELEELKVMPNYIISAYTTINEDDDELQMGVIAHEIGHAFLNHANGGVSLDHERQADEFANKHSFKVVPVEERYDKRFL